MTPTADPSPFRGLNHLVEPDYSRPVPCVAEPQAQRMRRRLSDLYSADEAAAAWPELERRIRVHRAYCTAEIEAAEVSFDPTERFTERDVVLITYGDLIVSGDRSPLATLEDFAGRFLGDVITTVHILPFFPYSSDRGFSVVSYEEVDPALGTWDEIAALERRFKLMFDGVFNHVSAKSRRFQQFLAGHPAFQDHFITFSTRDAIDDDRLSLILRPRTSNLLTEFATLDGSRWVWTTFSADQVDLNFKSPDVLLDIVDVLLTYVRRGADLLRLDAITYLWCELGTSCAHLEQTHQVVKLFRDVLDAAAPHVGLVTETNVPHADNITYFGDGRDEAQMVYNFALPPLVLHAFQTGRASVLTGWARDLEPPSPTTAFFNFLDSHDGIGLMGARDLLSEAEIEAMCRRVRDHGGFVSYRTGADGSESPYELNITWFSALNRADEDEPVDLTVARFLASRAIALVLRGVPGIYLPSFFGSRNDVEAVTREGSLRSINRTAFEAERLEEAFSQHDAIPARIFSRYRQLLECRVAEPAFHPAAPQEVFDLDARLLAVRRDRRDGSARVLTLCNVSCEAVATTVEPGSVGLRREVRDLLGSRSLQPGGDGGLRVELPPYGVAWLREI